MKTKLKKIGEENWCLELPSSVLQLLDINPDFEISISTDGKKIIVAQAEENTSSLPPIPEEENQPFENSMETEPEHFEENEAGTTIYEEQLEHYWNLAAERQSREKFMGSMRPILRARLGYDYSETICEQEAKKLCRKYYMAQERGEELQPPYLPEI